MRHPSYLFAIMSRHCHIFKRFKIFKIANVGDEIKPNDLDFHNLNNNWVFLFTENDNNHNGKNDFELFNVETVKGGRLEIQGHCQYV